MSFSIPANLIRQWCYCPRKVYYQEIMANLTITHPMWVKQGEDFHALEEKFWYRRNLSRFQLAEGKRYHQLYMHSQKWAMHGIADMLIETKEYVYPIEFKLSANHKKRGDILQLTAYALMAEEHFNKPSIKGFLVGKGKTLHLINMDDGHRQSDLKITADIRAMLEQGKKPNSSATIAQCCNCEYVNFCNDRV